MVHIPIIGITVGTGGNDKLAGSANRELIFGLGGMDLITGHGGSDTIFAGGGDDTVRGGSGDDIIYGGHGNDKLSGNSGDDVLAGGGGNDWFLFDPSNDDEGHDAIFGFTLGSDKIVLNAADILRADSDITTKTGDLALLDATDFDADSSWDVVASNDGDVLIIHPSGDIKLEGIAFSTATDSFAELLPALQLIGVTAGTSGKDNLVGNNGKDAIFGLAGNDKITGGRGDDVLVGGMGADKFTFNPNRLGEGDDVIYDFELGTDKIQLRVADVLASTPGLLGLSGDPNAFETTDLDVSTLWDLSASSDGDLLVTHPNGTIEINGLAFGPGVSTFGQILPALELI